MKKAAFPVPLLAVTLAVALVGCGSLDPVAGPAGPASPASPVAPTATTAGASSVTVSSATLNGSVNPNGTETSAWFEWGTDSGLGNSTATTEKPVGGGTGLQSVSETITDLAQGTTYYYRVVARNAGGVSAGDIARCTTALPMSPPAVSTNPATSVTGTGAQLNGSVTPNGLATAAWFEWGTSPTLASYALTAQQNVGSGLVSVAVNDTLTGLATGQTYYYRVAASNSLGTVRGDGILSFVAGTSPAVTTQPATSVSADSAVLNGSVSPNGLTTTAWFEWSTHASMTPRNATAPQPLPSVTGTHSVSAPLAGLSPETAYYFRVVAQNPAGSRSDVTASFTTLSDPDRSK